MTDVEKAKLALREAQIAEEIQGHLKERNEFGVCPNARGHFSGDSFLVGVVVGLACAVFAFVIIVNVTHAGGGH